MAHAIFLSKDRAAQIHLALEAIRDNGSHIFSNISVLYHSSNQEFAKGYEKVKKEFSNFNWIPQDSYYHNIMDLVDESFNLTSFFTDDDILYQVIPCSNKQMESNFDEMDILGTFSLRLGMNTYIQDPYISSHVVQPVSGFHEIDERMIIWRWADCPSYGNFGYPLSVDGHLFRTGELRKILKECKFNNPNQQEVAMQPFMNMLPPMMACFQTSVVINTPLNRVQDTCMNRAGENFGQTAEEMNIRYLNGEKLDLDSIDFSNIIGCHQELKINWITK